MSLSQSPRGRTLTLWSVVLLVGALGTWAFHSSVFSSRFDLIPGDEGDARLQTYLAEHWYQVGRGQGDARSPGMFYPEKGTIGYSDPLVAHAVPYSLLRMAGVEMLPAMAGAVVLISFLNYVACFILLRQVLHFQVMASCLGALFFAFNSPRLNHLGHFNLQPALFLPLVLCFVIQFGRNADRLTGTQAFGWLSLAALSLNVQLLAAVYPGWFFVVWSVLFLVIAVSAPVTRRFIAGIVSRFWLALIGSGVVFLVGLVPLAAVYFPAIWSVGWRGYGMVRRFIPEPLSLLLMGDRNYVWGHVSGALSGMLSFASSEHHLGIGLVPSVAWLALSIWAIWVVKTYATGSQARSEVVSARTIARVLLSVAILATSLFYVIGMKYWNELSPWALVYLFFPGAKGLQGVGRYVMVLALPMAIAFAFILHRAMQNISIQRPGLPRQCLTVALCAVVAFGLFEQLGRTPAFSASTNMSRLKRLAARLPDDCTAFYAVASPVRTRTKYEYQVDAMLVSIMRGVPTLNGYSGHVPPGWALREVEAPGYEEKVKQWIARHQLGGHICPLEVGD